MNRTYLLYLLGLAVVFLLVSIWLHSYTNSLIVPLEHLDMQHSHGDDFHVHADFLVILNGTIMNFSREEFMSDLHNELHRDVHLHDMNGNVIHFHEENITLDIFFTSLNMTFNETCFITHENISYCQDDFNSLHMFVNGVENTQMQEYVAEDLDQILIIFGNYSQSEIELYMNLVSDEACIYSMICEERIPEGGLNSSCVTGASCLVELDFLNQ